MEPLTSSVCRSCRQRLASCGPSSRRAFTTTPSSRAIPPESPLFVDVPKSFQPDYVPPPRLKGYLPVPRDIFPRNRPDKPSDQYLANVTPPSKRTVELEDVSETSGLTDQVRYKLRMAELRKSHLRSGLTELYQRKQKLLSRVQMRSDTKQAESARLVSQAPREDERLTNVSIPSTMRPEAIQAPTPAEALAIHERKTANVVRDHAQKDELRRDALHTLYMNARNFITTEEQLKDAVTEEFDNKKFSGELDGNKKSYWDAGEFPDSIKDMLDKQLVKQRFDAGVGDQHAYKRDQDRMKRIAEKLSGGKI